MGQWNTYSTKWDKNSVVSIHICGARYIFLLFYDDQDNASE